MKHLTYNFAQPN